MPCACKHAAINVPDNVEWGPVFWALLHGLAERAGSAPMPGLKPDEIRAWASILEILHKALPCDLCRGHLKTYITNNPVAVPDDHSALNLYVRQWLHLLHDDINIRLGKPLFLFEELSGEYGKVPLRNQFEVLQVLIKRAVQGSAVPLLAWSSWSKHVKFLLGLYN